MSNKSGKLFNNNEGNIFINDDKKKSKILELFFYKRFQFFLYILVFVFVSITVGKTFYLRNIVDEYEEYIIEIDNKESTESVVMIDDKNNDSNLKDIAASELVNCIKSSVDINNLPESITSIIDDINNYYNKSSNHFAFKYKDIYTGFSVSYNENQKIFTASTIKAPKVIYIYEMASQGKINLDDILTYTSGYYNTGTGVLKNKDFNTKYSVRTLANYSIVYSDNAAHNMLMNKYGRENMLEFWKNLGTDVIFAQNGNWGSINAHDASIYMEELYRFYVSDEEYGRELMNHFLGAKTKFISGKNGYKVANKHGWTGSVLHDVAIIFADNPYILVALSNLGQTDYYVSYFNKANDFAYRLHSEYWKYKMNLCSGIIQY